MNKRELLRLVWLNLMENKFKVVLTSVGIIIGAATIVMVIAIGKGGQEQVAKQFKNLNAGAIDISYEQEEEATSSEKSFVGGGPMGGMPGGNSSNSGSSSKSSSGNNSNNSFPGGNGGSDTKPNMGNFVMGGNNSEQSTNQEKITLSEDDLDDLETFVPNLSAATISYTTKSDVEGGELEDASNYTIAGVKSEYATMSNLTFQVGEFVTDEDEENKEKICILGASVAKEIFGDAVSAYDSTIYIDGRPYVVNGVLSEVGDVSSGISPDTAIFIPYSTGIKYLVGTDVNPTITVISSDLNSIDTTIENIKTVLAESYPNAEFTISDAGSKMEAASKSNETLTILLFAMAGIVFIVGGIGIMNVLFVSVKERTKEIGILKAIGCKKSDILTEFVTEASLISIFGGLLGILLSFIITPIVTLFQIPVILSVSGALIALCFAVATGTIFGIYPAWKASNLVPVEALSEE